MPRRPLRFLLMWVLLLGLGFGPYTAAAQQRGTAAAAPIPEPLPPITLPNFDLVTNLEVAPRPTKAKPARPGRVFDGPVTRDGALAAWRGGSLVAVYDYGVNCHIKVEPSCASLAGVETLPDPSGFSDERTVANPADPKFIDAFGRRIGRMLDTLRPRPRDLLAAHIDNLGLVSDRVALTLIYEAARKAFETRKLRPLYIIKNNMRGHVDLLEKGALRPDEVPYIVCENCLTKAGGAELEAGIVLARTYQKPIVLMEFGKAKLGWQNATQEQVEQLAARLGQENLAGFGYWGPDEDRYEFTRIFPALKATPLTPGAPASAAPKP